MGLGNLQQDENPVSYTHLDVYKRQVEKICDALGVTMAQFFAGMDVPVSLSESQQEVLNIWNNLDEKEQNVVIQMLRGLQN